MKLLNIEVTTRGEVFHSRYEIFRENGADIYYLTSSPKIAPCPHFYGLRTIADQSIETVITAAQAWHAEIGFDAIITTDEASVIATAAVGEALSLPGLTLTSARKSRNKYDMRLAHQQHNAPHPPFQLCDNVEQALQTAETIGYPVIVKPTLGGNAEHVYLIRDAVSLRQRFSQVREANRNYSYCQHEAQGIDLGPNSMLVEGYLSGSEHCVEAWVRDGKAHIGAVADRIAAELEIFDNDLYRTPTTLNPAQMASLQQALQAGVEAQGITHGVVHAEFRFHHGRPFILEIAARIGGGSLYKMARLSYGYCPVTAALRIAAGQPLDEMPMTATGRVAVGLTMLCEPGKIKSIHIPEQVAHHPDLFNLGLLQKAGDLNRRPPEGNDIFGYIGVTGSTQDEAINLASRLFSAIAIEFETETAAEKS
ncbi:carboxylate--amine ligase [Mixta theicola]|uniref:Carboxylate--amine ligase n=1 Tax=Mixta theicola TaxID=1458355 RepID=A0A2K1Q6L3_9GAMM|nr:ATP-grasp domain-containing protein [Mixta theicola]PNS10690.1 carboxylate--amine ligase [Mixta theicola]GLR10920.1 carboxylase [Mixta theicola]